MTLSLSFAFSLLSSFILSAPFFFVNPNNNHSTHVQGPPFLLWIILPFSVKWAIHFSGSSIPLVLRTSSCSISGESERSIRVPLTISTASCCDIFALVEKGKRDHQVMMAGYAKHVGFYPHPTVIEVFADQLSAYKFAKGSIQFPLNKPIPKELVIKMLQYRWSQLHK